MPLKPYWLRRLPEIIEKVRTLSAGTIDRTKFESIFQLRRRRAIELMHLLGSYRARRGFVIDRGALLQRLDTLETAIQYRWEQQARSPQVLEERRRAEANNVKTLSGSHHGPGRVVIAYADESELIEKLLATLRNVSDGEQGQIIARKPQYDRFEQAIRAFRKQSFHEAQALFAQACAGPDERIRTSAEGYLGICNRRLERGGEANSFEKHYTYGVALLNTRKLLEAREHFESALHIDPRADYVYYALAACLALSHDLAGVYSNLSRAIELQPRNRMAARHDSDFEAARADPAIARLLNPLDDV